MILICCTDVSRRQLIRYADLSSYIEQHGLRAVIDKLLFQLRSIYMQVVHWYSLCVYICIRNWPDIRPVSFYRIPSYFIRITDIQRQKRGQFPIKENKKMLNFSLKVFKQFVINEYYHLIIFQAAITLDYADNPVPVKGFLTSENCR